jgi:tetratricopeptide (TPR) repeat protein
MVQVFRSGPIKLRIGGLASQAQAEAEDASVGAALSALDRGDLEAAARLADAALRSGVERAELLCVMAMALQEDGRPDAAIPYLQRAIALAPADISILNALARCLVLLERPTEALAVAEKALALQPQSAGAHAHKGQALEWSSQLAAAEHSYLKALELEPDQITARVGMASLCSHYGAHDQARAHAQAVLDAAPDDPSAAVIMAVADLAQGAPAAAEARIRTLLAAPRPAPRLWSYLGDALDAQDRAPEAFEAYGRAGETLRGRHGWRFAGPDVLMAAERTAGELERLPQVRWPRPQHDPAPPGEVTTHVFLLGFARSGTSLLGLSLAGHEQVEVLDEREALIEAMGAFAGDAGLDRLLAASDAELDPYREAYWRAARAAGARLQSPVFVDKHPMNSLNLPLIARLFPGAKILIARRDPRDVVLSCIRRRFLMNRYTYQLLAAESAARLYSAAMRLTERVDALAAPDALVASHEDLVENFEGEMLRICVFLGLPWSDALTSFSGRVRASGMATPSASQLAQGLNSDGVGQWRRYAQQLQPLAPILDPWVRRFGYDRASRSAGATDWQEPSLHAGLELMG